MSTTPQIIKDQEFQVKFRGYDTVEVKAYLDVIAEEFFELQERCRLQVDDLQVLHEEREDLEQQKISLQASNAESRKMEEELRQSGLRTEQKLAVSIKEAEGLHATVDRLEEEKKAQAEALTSADVRIHELEETILQERAGKEALRHKIDLMEEQQQEAKKDEVDFKSTLAAAQQFCDAMKEKSKQQAEQLLDGARTEIENLSRTAHAELARLPAEIKALQDKREEVRKVLRATLESYLQDLDFLPGGLDGLDRGRECDDLFQKIEILEDGSLGLEELAAFPEDLSAFSSPDAEMEPLSVGDGDESARETEDDERI